MAKVLFRNVPCSIARVRRRSRAVLVEGNRIKARCPAGTPLASARSPCGGRWRRHVDGRVWSRPTRT